MKRIGLLCAMGLLLATSMPAFAQQMTPAEKDQCLLSSQSCKNEADSIQKKIKQLQKEIKKGKAVYSADEIKKLEGKLKEANDLLDDLLKGGGK